ncbi:EF hand calcium-binding family protein [Heracleum sosnowskyi]|uniref:EF hand calcium-binding family protein n=1 Tax=Heracleum sosnowskyi TaxID=360622 RepID=A0AAD8M3A5_9APIA|nr:EF hand calcium-binding family protein [Heracleum sosnowskyi]
MELRSFSFIYICMFLNWLTELHGIYSVKLYATIEFIFVACKSPVEDTKSEAEKRSSPDEEIDCGRENVLLRGDVEMVMERLGLFCRPRNGEMVGVTLRTDEMATLFDENEPSIDEVRQAFHLYDENCDGYIDEHELKNVLERLGIEGLSERECQDMIAAYDFNGDRKIDFAEFFKIVEDSFC